MLEMPASAPLAGHDGPVDRILALIREKGGRVTGPKRATVEILAGSDHRHLSAEEIAEEVRRRQPDVAPSTIYRILSALEDIGVVTHVHLGHGPSTYHLADDTHRHLVCRTCNAVIEIPDHELTSFKQRLATAYGFTVADEHFALVGDCQACRAAQAAPA